MGKTEIITALPHLIPADLIEVQAKLDELAGNTWQDQGALSDIDKQSLEAAISDYQHSPDAGSIWDEIKSRIQQKLQP